MRPLFLSSLLASTLPMLIIELPPWMENRLEANPRYCIISGQGRCIADFSYRLIFPASLDLPVMLTHNN